LAQLPRCDLRRPVPADVERAAAHARSRPAARPPDPRESKRAIALAGARKAGIEDDRAAAVELGRVRRASPADEHAAARKQLRAPEKVGEDGIRSMRVCVHERDALPLRVERELERARLRLLLRRRGVVEDGDEAALVLADVVLPLEPGTRPEPKVAPLAAQAPEYAARAPLELVGRPGVPRRDDQVPVRRHVDRFDVEVGEAGPGLRPDRGLGDRDVVEAVPLPEEPAARQLELLHDAADHVTPRAPADAS